MAYSCDTATGVCGETPEDGPTTRISIVTDPLCSACWVFEPAWRAFVHRYGHHVTLRHVYGVLLPGWTGFADPGAGIFGPADVPAHWDEAARATGQPIDSSVWLTDPVTSTVPAAAALLRVRAAAPALEGRYLRRLRELVFAEARNIARADVLRAAAVDVGVADPSAVAAPPDDAALSAIEEERAAMRALGARSFPTLVFDSGDQQLRVAGAQPYARLVQLLSLGDPQVRPAARPDAAEAIQAYERATTAEIAALTGLDQAAAEAALRACGAAADGLLWARP